MRKHRRVTLLRRLSTTLDRWHHYADWVAGFALPNLILLLIKVALILGALAATAYVVAAIVVG